MILHAQSIYFPLAIINEISLVRTGYLLERERLIVNTVKNSARVIYTKTTNCATFFNLFFIKYIASGRCSSGKSFIVPLRLQPYNTVTGEVFLC